MGGILLLPVADVFYCRSEVQLVQGPLPALKRALSLKVASGAGGQQGGSDRVQSIAS